MNDGDKAAMWNWWPYSTKDADYVGDHKHLWALALYLSAVGEERDA